MKYLHRIPLIIMIQAYKTMVSTIVTGNYHINFHFLVVFFSFFFSFSCGNFFSDVNYVCIVQFNGKIVNKMFEIIRFILQRKIEISSSISESFWIVQRTSITHTKQSEKSSKDIRSKFNIEVEVSKTFYILFISIFHSIYIRFLLLQRMYTVYRHQVVRFFSCFLFNNVS